jgi:histidinol-phosphatase
VWDLAALDIVVRESGGAFTSLSGREGPHGGTVVATNGLLQLAVLDRLNGG